MDNISLETLTAIAETLSAEELIEAYADSRHEFKTTWNYKFIDVSNVFKTEILNRMAY